MKKRSIILLIAAIIGLLITFYLWSYTSGAVSNTSSGAEALGAAIAMRMAQPMMLMFTLSTIFCVVAWLFKIRWAALVAGILYAVSMALLPAWAMFPIIPMILSFIGYARMGKANKEPKTEEKTQN